MNKSESIYLSLNYNEFVKLIKIILKSNSDDENIKFIEKCLYKQGVLIKKSEIPSFSKNDNNYIGYINIYDTTNKGNDFDKLDINMHTKGTNIFNVDLTKRERDELFKSRKKSINIPDDMTKEDMPWGTIESFKNKDNFINKLKIFSTDPVVGKGIKTGRVCETYHDSDHNKFINQINKTKDEKMKFKNKKLYCDYIANKLIELNKLVLLPIYKPKS